MRIRVTTDSYEVEFKGLKKEDELEGLLDLLQAQSYIMFKTRYDLQMEASKEAAGVLHAMNDLSKIKLPGEDK